MYKILTQILIRMGIRNHWKWKLDDEFSFEDEYFEGVEAYCEWASMVDGELIIKEGYAWNGCSPSKSYWSLFVLGTPDGVTDITTGKQKAYYASLVHDALCQYEFIERKHADRIFYELLKDAEFLPAIIYYLAVRLFGRRFKPNKYT
jgi:hypothetical protein